MFRESRRAGSLRKDLVGRGHRRFVTCALMLVEYWSFRGAGAGRAGHRERADRSGAVGCRRCDLRFGIRPFPGLPPFRGPQHWSGFYWPTRSSTRFCSKARHTPAEDGFEGDIVPIASALLLLIAGGHLLGVVAHRNLGRRKLNAEG